MYDAEIKSFELMRKAEEHQEHLGHPNQTTCSICMY